MSHPRSSPSKDHLTTDEKSTFEVILQSVPSLLNYFFSLPSFSEKKEVSPSRIPAKRKTTLGTKSKKKGGRANLRKLISGQVVFCPVVRTERARSQNQKLYCNIRDASDFVIESRHLLSTLGIVGRLKKPCFTKRQAVSG